MKQIILDTETTGFDHAGFSGPADRICEIGILELLPSGGTFTRLHAWLNPERELSEGAARVNGLSWDRLKSEPRFAEIRLTLIETLTGAELIIHNADFDLNFIDAELNRSRLAGVSARAIAGKITCTRELARRVLPGKKHSLDLLCDHYGIDRSHRQQHDAITDCRLLARVYRQLMADAA
ncbi:MAG: exonuclease domain-containing protein [Gammaproteobacteria bacterium SHHR-1]